MPRAHPRERKKEADKALQRLLAVNQALEEKLKTRTDESTRSHVRICDLERRIEHGHNVATEKGHKIRMLQEELAKTARMQEDILLRERNYGERMMKLRVDEFQSSLRDSERKKKLEKVIRGEEVTEDEQSLGEEDLHVLATKTLKRMQTEFTSFFDQREENMKEVAQLCEEQATSQQMMTVEAALETARVPSRVRQSVFGFSNCGPMSVDAEVQTEPEQVFAKRLTLMSEGPKPGNRGCSPIASAIASRRSLVVSSPVRQTSGQSGHRSVTLSRHGSISSEKPSAADRQGDRQLHKATSFKATTDDTQSDGGDSLLSEQAVPRPSSAGSGKSGGGSQRGGDGDGDGYEDRGSPEPESLHSSQDAGSLRGASPEPGAQSFAAVHREGSPIEGDLETSKEMGHAFPEATAEPQHFLATPPPEFIDEDMDELLPMPPREPAPEANSTSTKIRGTQLPVLAKAQQADPKRSTTPSTRASSRNESRAGARSSTPGQDSRSSTPFPDPKPKQQARPQQPKTQKRTVLAFDRT